ncbi:MAG: universal stress protein [Bryobacteraceae bacterium]
MSLKNILFPIASPERVKTTLPGVAHMINTLRADLTLMRVVDPFREGGPKPALHELKLLKPEEHGLDRCRIHIHAHSDEAASIAQYAREQEMDAIFLPFQRAGLRAAFSRTWSLAKKLLVQSPCPVWLMGPSPSGDSSRQDIRRILCAVSGRDLHVLKAAAEVSRTLNARLFLLHVVPEVQEGTLAFGFDDHVALSVENGLELLARMQGDAGTEALPIVHAGSLWDSIHQMAQSLNVDLVVTGRKRSKVGPFGAAGWQGGFAPLLPLTASQMLMV